MKVNVGKRGGLPPRLVILGEQKVGKTTFASQFPKAIVIPTEDGCSQIEGLAYFDKQTTWQGILNCIKQLGTEQHDYKTVIIDTLDGAEILCRDSVLERDFKGDKNKFKSWGQGEGVTAMEYKALLDYLDRLRDVKQMTIVCLCHVGIQNVNNPMSGDYTKFTGSMGKHTWGATKSWADQIGYACYDTVVIRSDDTDKKGKIKSKSEDRFLVFAGSGGVDVGCRAGYEMPDKILLTYEAYKKASESKE